MPREGYSTVTIPVQVHHRLHETAQNEYRSMPKQIEHMLNKLYPNPSNLKQVKCKSCGHSIADPNGHSTPKFCVNCGAAVLRSGGMTS